MISGALWTQILRIIGVAAALFEYKHQFYQGYYHLENNNAGEAPCKYSKGVHYLWLM